MVGIEQDFKDREKRVVFAKVFLKILYATHAINQAQFLMAQAILGICPLFRHRQAGLYLLTGRYKSRQRY